MSNDKRLIEIAQQLINLAIIKMGEKPYNLESNAKELLDIAQELINLALVQMGEKPQVAPVLADKPKVKPVLPIKQSMYDLGDVVQIVNYQHDLFGEQFKTNCVYWCEVTDKWRYRGDLGTFNESDLKLVQRGGNRDCFGDW